MIYFYLKLQKGDTQATALNALVKLCLGKKLNKSNQFSNWEKRPLRKEQIIYAGKYKKQNILILFTCACVYFFFF